MTVYLLWCTDTTNGNEFLLDVYSNKKVVLQAKKENEEYNRQATFIKYHIEERELIDRY